ncbi:protein FAR1-RELATED SEQUENCE 5-like [Rosa chinensis]|uniref:protein FAR1-RELATED SEQUENCE 5-like n=1 Tax=Rosa chinensis TaxID=74649 RepID=UPI000D090305|nr:protein FAR1-RELATED SEQUENCE 5-like [Rosa chinensis]
MQLMDLEDNCKEDEIQTNSRRKLDFENGTDMNTCVEDESLEEKVTELRHVEGNEKVDYVHSKIRKELIPIIVMEFDTENDACSFYNAYAYGVGFSVRRFKFHKDKSGKFLDRFFVCSAEGKRDSEKDQQSLNVKAHRAETRFGCLARMKIKIWKASGRYHVIEFVSEHNGHETSSPSKSYFFRSHRSVNTAQIA